MKDSTAIILGLFLFLSVYVACDAWLFSKGYNTAFFEHKTKEEKEIRLYIIEKHRVDLGLNIRSDYIDGEMGK